MQPCHRSPPRSINRSAVSSGLTTLEVLVALVVLLVGVHGILALHALTMRHLYRALSVSHLASEEASLVDSLAGKGCAPSSGTRSMNEGHIAWRGTSSATALTIDVLVTPRHGAPWQSEAVLRC